MYGQLKEVYPKWEGFENLTKNIEYIESFYSKCKQKIIIKDDLLPDLTAETNIWKRGDDNYGYDGYYSSVYLSKVESIKDEDKVKNLLYDVAKDLLPITSGYGKIVDSINKLQQLNFTLNIKDLKDYFKNLKEYFPQLKNTFLENYYYYARILKGWGKILTMIYFCLLLIATFFACVSMMFYSCLRNQGYLSTFMHVLWNIIRFFMFSFFFYGGAYGMCYLALRDAIGYVMFVFGKENLESSQPRLIPTEKEGKDYLKFCLINEDNDYKNRIDITLRSSLDDFFTNYNELKNIFKDFKEFDYSSKKSEALKELKEEEKTIKPIIEEILKQQTEMINKIKTHFQGDTDLCNSVDCSYLPEIALRKGGLFGSFDCSCLKSDLSMMYRTLYDLNVEARILCALSCCIGFFGAIAVYFFLLVLHHYDNEIFFDAGSSVFIGFEGFGNKRKSSNKDPTYKKRKIRSEIELSSRNEDYSGNQIN
jgi:hypothetical protein